jgi:NADPH-dependent curcumin reductase CurA
VLVRNLFMSVDPYMRGRMNEGKSYVPPFELGKPLEGGAVGEVIESRAKEFKPGDAVTSNFGWREYFIASPKDLHPVSREIQPLSVYLGALGMTGMTAWAGLNLVEVKAGDVILFREPPVRSAMWPGNWRNCAGAGSSDRPVHGEGPVSAGRMRV